MKRLVTRYKPNIIPVVTRYKPDAIPVTCADCGELLRYDPERFAWRHASKPAEDHAPRPAGTVRR